MVLRTSLQYGAFPCVCMYVYMCNRVCRLPDAVIHTQYCPGAVLAGTTVECNVEIRSVGMCSGRSWSECT